MRSNRTQRLAQRLSTQDYSTLKSLRALLPVGIMAFLVGFSMLLSACVGVAPVDAPPAPTAVEHTTLPSEREPQRQPHDVITESSTPYAQWAFIRDQVLYLHLNGEEREIEDCRGNRCDIYHPSWSPGGQYLLYYVGTTGETPANLIRVAHLDGRIQTLTDQAAYIRPAGWSPSGDTAVYFKATGRYREHESVMGLEEIFEVWIAEIEDEGGFEDADPPSDFKGEFLSEIGFGLGCGGGGRSESALVYEREGGYAYGYLAGVIHWTADDILLYSNNCTSRFAGRFDLARGQTLEPYPDQVRGLVMNADRDAWVAIDAAGRLILGTPGSLETVTLGNTHPAELVYWGAGGETFYYTTLETTYTGDLSEQVGRLGETVWLSPYFDQAQATIRRYDPHVQRDELVWRGDDYAYARIHENSEGVLLFSAIEPVDRLYRAIQENRLTADNWREFLPSVRIEMLQAGQHQPVQLFEQAGAYVVRQ